MVGILAVFAQMERENIQTRMKDNYAYRIKDGRWASGKASFGFKNGKVDNKATLIPIPEEIEEYLVSLNKTKNAKIERQKQIKKQIAGLQKQFDNLVEIASYSDELASSLKIRLDRLIVEIMVGML